jgi:hypothetical protein
MWKVPLEKAPHLPLSCLSMGRRVKAEGRRQKTEDGRRKAEGGGAGQGHRRAGFAHQ